MAQLMFPNIAGQVQQGFDRGRGMAFNRLAGLAMQNPDQAQGYLGQAAGIDPRGALALQGALDQRQAVQQQAQQAQQQDAAKKIGSAARYMIAALQTQNPAQIEGAYQAVRPYLAELGRAQGKTPPPQWDPNMESAIYQVAAKTAGLFPNDNKLYNLGAGGRLVNGQGSTVASAPYPIQPLASGYGFDKNTGQAVQIPIQGGGNGVGMGAAVPGAGAAPSQAPGLNTSVPGTNGQSVRFNFPPGTPPEVIAAAQASAVANGDIAPGQQVGIPQQAAQGAPQTLADAMQAAKSGASKDVITQRAQQIAELKARGVEMSPEDQQQYLLTGKSADFQGGSNATLFGDPTKTGPAYLQTIPQGNREIVKGLLDGTVSLPTGTTLKSPLWQSALASVKHADPSWNQAAFKQYADTRKWATIGQGGQLINSINTASQHLDKLREDIAALNNGNIRPLTAAENFVSSHAGGQAVTNFNADLTPVASELAAVYKGKGVPSDEEIRHFRDALTPNMSYGQQMNVIRGWIDLLSGKLAATREQYRGSMSKLSSPLSVINPHAAEALERITTLANQVSTTGQHPMPAEDTSPIYAPGGQSAQPQAAPSGWSIEKVQ